MKRIVEDVNKFRGKVVQVGFRKSGTSCTTRKILVGEIHVQKGFQQIRKTCKEEKG